MTHRNVAELRQIFYGTREPGQTIGEAEFNLFRCGYALGNIDGKADTDTDRTLHLAQEALDAAEQRPHDGDPIGYYVLACALSAAGGFLLRGAFL